MSGNKIILFLLGFIIIIILVLSSKKIAGSLRERFGKFVPGVKIQITPTTTPTATPIKYSSKNNINTPIMTIRPNKNDISIPKSSPSDEIPATGTNEILYLFIISLAGAGYYLIKQTKIKV